jgi:hypothetical protein
MLKVKHKIPDNFIKKIPSFISICQSSLDLKNGLSSDTINEFVSNIPEKKLGEDYYDHNSLYYFKGGKINNSDESFFHCINFEKLKEVYEKTFKELNIKDIEKFFDFMIIPLKRKKFLKTELKYNENLSVQLSPIFLCNSEVHISELDASTLIKELDLPSEPDVKLIINKPDVILTPTVFDSYFNEEFVPYNNGDYGKTKTLKLNECICKPINTDSIVKIQELKKQVT